MIDLRSDTVTKLNDFMTASTASVDVGDDLNGEAPSVEPVGPDVAKVSIAEA